MAGRESGRAASVVIPPAAAASAAEAMVSRVLIARFTQGSAHVDEARAEDRTVLGNHRRTVRSAQAGSKVGDQAIAREQIATKIDT